MTSTDSESESEVFEVDESLQPAGPPPLFILYQAGEAYLDALEDLTRWVHGLLMPVYGREVTSVAPWCPEWWRHPEAVAQLHGLFLAWQTSTGGGSDMTGPAVWHRDFLGPVMSTLRDPSGPFAGCKSGAHRDKETPAVAPFDLD